MVRFYSVKRYYDHMVMFFLYAIPNMILRLISLICWPRPIRASLSKICIYRIGNIGDLSCAIPVLISIREQYPNAKITLLTSPGPKGRIGANEFFQNAWFIDEIINYYSEDISNLKGVLNLFKKIKKRRFEAWFYLPKELDTFSSLLKAMFFAKACEAGWSFGYFLATNRLFREYQFKRVFFLNEVERLRTIFGNCFSHDSKIFKYEFPHSPEDSLKAEEIMAGMEKSGPIVGFVTKAKRPHNEWPIEKFESLGRLIKKKYPASRLVIMGGTDACRNAQYLKEKLGDDFVLDLAGRITLPVTSELLLSMDLLITLNTGPMHLASMQDVPTAAIFSSAEFHGKWYPYGEKTKIFINEAVPCAGCYYTKNCEYECIKGIKVEDVWREVCHTL